MLYKCVKIEVVLLVPKTWWQSEATPQKERSVASKFLSQSMTHTPPLQQHYSLLSMRQAILSVLFFFMILTLPRQVPIFYHVICFTFGKNKMVHEQGKVEGNLLNNNFPGTKINQSINQSITLSLSVEVMKKCSR